ncbi:MAG: outer membrane protein OmpA [Pseudomonadota bacterium]|uniref:outer membrane protein OmpA n=1 Tax=Sulfuricystis thermophila TaxID=2496847 RepID=UPI0010359214|nr:OmpA family protein [Sulfuricystis thermophila]MDI6750158.1 OmpA family protein [Rhodocyclaceae bacterium]
MIKLASKHLLMAALAAGIGAAAQAQTPGVDLKGTVGYVIDQRGYVAKSGTGLCWRTGYWTPAMAIAECDPDLVPKAAPAPAPAPAPAAQPAPAPKPAAKKVTLAADALFDFDKATLRPEGKAKLDKLVSDIGAIKLEVIIAVGHADRIGKDAYNQKLSERRAAAVKDYLVSKGIEANRVYAEGKGEKQPVTGDKCNKMGPENRKNKKLIECLQPDRRVEIEVIGTQN